MVISLSNLVDNLIEGIRNFKCNGCDCFLEYESVKDNFIKYELSSCNKHNSNKIDEELKKQFRNAFKFSKDDIDQFILLLTIVKKKKILLMSIWMISKSLIKHHCLKKDFIAI